MLRGGLLIGVLGISMYILNILLFEESIKHDWYIVCLYGLITCFSTGLGALPFFVVKSINPYWLGFCNALACGMMLGASFSLFVEGVYADPKSLSWQSFFDMQLDNTGCRTLCGFMNGIFFIIMSKKYLDRYDNLSIGDLKGADAKQAILLIGVMTVHSFSEGVGIGVSFGGEGGKRLGVVISTALAIHNIPEGLAIALVLTSKGVSPIESALWAIFSSIPQPMMGVPAYLFVEHFLYLLPVGLGFASGAMVRVAMYELFVEAMEFIGAKNTSLIVLLSFTLMVYVQLQIL